MAHKNTNILIIDDHAVVRAGLRLFVDQDPTLQIGGEARNAEAAIEMVRAQEWDLVMLDISLPDQDGMAVLRAIHQEKPELPVLMYSSFSETQAALNCLKAGAAGYLVKDSSPDEVRAAIRRVAGGERYISQALASHLLALATQTAPTAPPHTKLSPRELEIMKRIATGQSLTEIGLELHNSVKTISTHRRHILEKMGMSSNAELTIYMIEQGLLENSSKPAGNKGPLNDVN